MFNVDYEKNGETFYYLDRNVGIDLAFESLDAFQRRYLNEDGTGKKYPNGKGFYNFTNPRVIKV